MSSTPGSEECGRYLATLFADAPERSFVELRVRTAAGMRCEYLHVVGLGEVAATVARRAPDTDVYVGVLPRHRHGGRYDDLVAEGSVLWADCDTAASVAALDEFAARPSMMVASGTARNRHAYWLLDEPVPLRVLEAANRRLARLIGADLSCADAARILRPPSMNHKHVPPSPVVLLSLDTSLRRRVDDIVGPINADTVVRNCRQRRLRAAGDDPLLEVAPARYVEVLAGLRVPPHRKVVCPFHDDASPSLHVYREPDRGWYCYGCGRGGTVYDFAALLWDRQTRGAGFVQLRNELQYVLCS